MDALLWWDYLRALQPWKRRPVLMMMTLTTTHSISCCMTNLKTSLRHNQWNWPGHTGKTYHVHRMWGHHHHWSFGDRLPRWGAAISVIQGEKENQTISKWNRWDLAQHSWKVGPIYFGHCYLKKKDKWNSSSPPVLKQNASFSQITQDFVRFVLVSEDTVFVICLLTLVPSDTKKYRE